MFVDRFVSDDFINYYLFFFYTRSRYIKVPTDKYIKVVHGTKCWLIEGSFFFFSCVALNTAETVFS